MTTPPVTKIYFGCHDYFLQGLMAAPAFAHCGIILSFYDLGRGNGQDFLLSLIANSPHQPKPRAKGTKP